jgi:hypothetical protein
MAGLAVFTSVKDENIKRICLHVYNKYRGKVIKTEQKVQPDGSIVEVTTVNHSKKKFTNTSSHLKATYRLQIEPHVLKNANTSVSQ